MAYDEKLADRIREALVDIPNVEEKKMFRGVTFMVNDKMCISVSGENIMCRIDPSEHNTLMDKDYTHEMIKAGKAIKGFIYVGPDGIKSTRDLDFWINLCLAFNSKAKSSKKSKNK